MPLWFCFTLYWRSQHFLEELSKQWPSVTFLMPPTCACGFSEFFFFFLIFSSFVPLLSLLPVRGVNWRSPRSPCRSRYQRQDWRSSGPGPQLWVLLAAALWTASLPCWRKHSGTCEWVSGLHQCKKNLDIVSRVFSPPPSLWLYRCYTNMFPAERRSRASS